MTGWLFLQALRRHLDQRLYLWDQPGLVVVASIRDDDQRFDVLRVDDIVSVTVRAICTQAADA